MMIRDTETLSLRAIGLVLLLWARPALGAVETVPFGAFGSVRLMHESPQPAHVVLFISGAQGWDAEAKELAGALTAMDVLVVGVDLTQFLPRLETVAGPCIYPAGDCEELGQFAEKRLGYAHYVTPVLAGLGRGGTLAYAALVQAPSNTFLGGVSFDFCPELAASKVFCRGDGLAWETHGKGQGYRFLPAAALAVPWIVIQEAAGPECAPAVADSFVRRTALAEYVPLAGKSVAPGAPPARVRAFQDAVSRLFTREMPPPAPTVASLADLPLVEAPAEPGAPAGAPPPHLLAVHLTGDGGWSVTDKGLSHALAAHGIPVVALNSLHYFWAPRTPDEAGKDLERILAHYLSAWQKDEVVLIGYSLGADVLPFMVNRLAPEMRARVRLVALLGPGREAEFEIHAGAWLGRRAGQAPLPVRPEVEKMKGMEILCFHGERETDSLCPDLEPGLATVIERGGGHRVLWGYEPVAQAILDALAGVGSPGGAGDGRGQGGR